MNKKLATYLLSLKSDVSVRIWLKAISVSNQLGTANILFKDLLIEHRIQEKNLKKFFNPKEAADLGVIKLLIDTDTFVSINFKTSGKMTAEKVKLPTKFKKLIEPNSEAALITKPPTPVTTENLPTVTGETSLGNSDLAEIKIYSPYTVSEKLKRAVIFDYTQFFKQLQVNKAMLAGVTLAFDQAAPPAIDGATIKNLKVLCQNFSKVPGVLNEDMIRRCFWRIYQNIDSLDEYVRNHPQPGIFLHNYNTIIIQLQNLHEQRKNPTQNKREAEFNEKTDRAAQRDYSHLSDKRKKDN